MEIVDPPSHYIASAPSSLSNQVDDIESIDHSGIIY